MFFNRNLRNLVKELGSMTGVFGCHVKEIFDKTCRTGSVQRGLRPTARKWLSRSKYLNIRTGSIAFRPLSKQ